jgi:glycosyltransferase involved in cell wall biosynthesis
MQNPADTRLAIFIPDLVLGGAERSMLKLAGGMAARGYPIDMVLARAEGPFLKEVPKTVRVVDLKASRVLTSLFPLVRYMREERPAAILAVLHANNVALWARKLSGAKTRIIVSERNTLSTEAEAQKSDLRMRLMPALVRWFYPWSDGVVAVSQGVADDLVQTVGLPAELVKVIYNPIVTPEMIEKVKAPLEHPWFAPGLPPVILSVGRLSEQKDFPTLLRAFAKVRQTHTARLLIIGEGEDRAALEGLVQELGLGEDVSLPGFIANPYPYMVRADMFVLSSRWEGLPGALIEALYCGAPLVSTDCPSGPREILAGGKYGRLTPVGDVDAMAEAIRCTLDGQTPRPAPDSWKRFEMNTVVDQFLEALLGK